MGTISATEIGDMMISALIEMQATGHSGTAGRGCPVPPCSRDILPGSAAYTRCWQEDSPGLLQLAPLGHRIAVIQEERIDFRTIRPGVVGNDG